MNAYLIRNLIVLYEKNISGERFVRIHKALYGLYIQMLEIFFGFIIAIFTLFMSFTKNKKQKSDYFELSRRQLNKPKNLNLQSFGNYVYVVRRDGLQISRKELTKRARLEDENLLFFLENHLLEPKELTNEIWQKLETALGLTYEEFKQLQHTISY